jgi:hypothetical protein
MLVYRSVIVTGIVTNDQLTSRRPCPGHGQARSRLATELAGCPIALVLAATGPTCTAGFREIQAASAGMRSETAVRMRRSVGTAIEKITEECFRSSTPVSWAWLDLNQRPHPYQRWTADRCADWPFRWSCDSVRPTRMG